MTIICPYCKMITTWEENPHRPFCSERCRLIDLGKWASGEYVIKGDVKFESIPSERENEND
ncbi:MAG: DNA gyrase inhibitor YacG [Nitrospirae bacterium]|nr:DNA gyrase inhibitor YacG [Nitrospirota bacterium]